MEKLKYILLVDDDEIANHLHSLLISDLNIAEHIEVATDGEEALEIIDARLQEEHSDDFSMLALVDINMPGMDAFEFLNEYENMSTDFSPNIHIVLLSSSSNPKDKEKAEKYNISGYMIKPLTEEKLMDIVKAM